jgi:hypothetical protein
MFILGNFKIKTVWAMLNSLLYATVPLSIGQSAVIELVRELKIFSQTIEKSITRAESELGGCSETFQNNMLLLYLDLV